jgi:hypothetical protein
MTLRNPLRPILILAVLALASAGCSRRGPTEPWPLSTDPVVFSGTFGSHVAWQAFGNSDVYALTLDKTESHSTGKGALKLVVAASGSYAGGALTTDRLRNLASYNAIRFWAKGSRAVTLDVVGFGNNNAGTSLYTAQRAGVAITNAWAEYYIVIPNPARLGQSPDGSGGEGGMFFVSAGPKAGGAFTFWLDDIEFVNVPTISNPRPILSSQTVDGIAGSALSLDGSTRTAFAVGGVDQLVTHSSRYFDYVSSDPSVARAGSGTVDVVGAGTATVTAQLAGVNATGTVTVHATLPPATAAPAPTLPAASVFSLFSDVYPDSVQVDTWNANWNQPGGGIRFADVLIAGNATKRYMNLSYAGIEFVSRPVNATAKTAFHLDVWAPSGTTFKVKLVDFGADGVFGGGNDSESELTFNAASTPAFTSGTWAQLEIPLANFAALASRAHLAQLVLSSPDAKIVYVDNIYFHQ